MFDPDAFSTAFVLPQSDPQPEPIPQDEVAPGGPWLSHGVVHLRFPPKNH